MASVASSSSQTPASRPNKLRKRVNQRPSGSDSARASDKDGSAAPTPKKARPQWLLWALASGAFAACNGVFAKLTTAGRTHALVQAIAQLIGLEENIQVLEVIARAIFFGLNLLSNAIMWFLFTRALTLATSTTRVSILNTSANFLVTAVLGMFVFGEHLPLGWWMGAALLVAGSVIIGAREGKESTATPAAGSDDDQGEIVLPDNPDSAGERTDTAGRAASNGGEPYRDNPIDAVATEEPVELRR